LTDQDRIKQVITNLVDNANKFTEKGTITLATEIDDGYDHVTVKVKDMGRGIHPEIIPKLFTRLQNLLRHHNFS
jgi:signal transduction histidine kinase